MAVRENILLKNMEVISEEYIGFENFEDIKKIAPRLGKVIKEKYKLKLVKKLLDLIFFLC